MVGYVSVVVMVGWLVIMIGGLGRECGGWDDEEGGVIVVFLTFIFYTFS